MNAQVLVIGHTGFIGKAIAEDLEAKKIKFQGIATEECDLRKPQSINYLSKVFKKNTTLIITASINRELGDTAANMQTHIDMIANIAHALEKQSIKRCVYLSSADVYGRPKKLPIFEETPVNPQTYYATAKYTCEKILEITAQKSNFPLLVLRYNGIFGPGQSLSGYGPNAFIKTIIKEQLVEMWGDGQELRDNVYVKDLAKIITMLTSSEAHGAINIATGKSQPYANMVKELKNIASEKFKIIHKKRTFPAFDQKFNIARLKKFVDLRFTIREKALEETYQYYKKAPN